MISRTVRRRVKKCLLWMEVLFILILGAAVGVVAGAFYQISKVLPPQRYLQTYKTPAGTTIWSSDHVLLARLANENREPVSIDHIPLVMQRAMVDIEDSRFYQHSGLDIRGAARALWTDLHGRDLTQLSLASTRAMAEARAASPPGTLDFFAIGKRPPELAENSAKDFEARSLLVFEAVLIKP